MTEPIYCPLGGVDGCEIKDGRGTCEAARTGRVRKGETRVCLGYGAVVCERAYLRWEADGKPDHGAAVAAAMNRPEPPAMDPQSRWMDPALATAPGNFGAWTIYGEDVHEKGRQLATRDHVEAVVKRYGVAWDAPNLVFQGAPGTGKTLLARVAGRVASDAGLRVRFCVFRELLLGVKATRDASSQAVESAIMQPYVEADLLIVDDVRPVFDSQDDENIADELFKARYGEDRGGRRRPTIVTSNLSKGELRDVIGEAAMRRLLCDGAVERQIFDWEPWREEDGGGVPDGHWSDGTFCLFDVETTGKDPEVDRIVQASFIVQNPDGSAGEGSYTALVNPGMKISDEAVAIHGITNARAKREGVAPALVLEQLTRRFQRAGERGYPVVIFNVPFDWPLYVAECKRHNLGGPMTRPMFVDPLLIDRKADRYRKGPRTLSAMVKHYLGREFEAHDATKDALEMGLLLREMVRRHKVLQGPTLDELQELQRAWWRSWQDQFNEYQRGPRGKGHLSAEVWPV
ncbi:MAG: ATP-binding protein [Planctomycetota bacterium]|jgi:DNA polymerase-3 subunit epsilon